jgi:predicted NAD-dependent protein-ADP-ribosyltransferase YbiA (DUF1768 family)
MLPFQQKHRDKTEKHYTQKHKTKQNKDTEIKRKIVTLAKEKEQKIMPREVTACS